MFVLGSMAQDMHPVDQTKRFSLFCIHAVSAACAAGCTVTDIGLEDVVFGDVVGE